MLFRSREHENCAPQPGFVRAHIESKFNFPLLLSETIFVFRKYFGVLLCITDLVSDLLALFSGGGFNISPMKPRNGRPRAQVQHLMQIDLKGWGVGYISSFQQHCLLQMLNCVAGKNLWFIVVGRHHLGFSIGVLLVCWQVLNDLI